MTIMEQEYLDGVSKDPAVMAGKPVVRGTRIPVDMILRQIAFNPDFNEAFAMWPALSLDDLRACFGYASMTVARHGKSVLLITSHVQRIITTSEAGPREVQ